MQWLLHIWFRSSSVKYTLKREIHTFDTSINLYKIILSFDIEDEASHNLVLLVMYKSKETKKSLQINLFLYEYAFAI